MLPLALLVLLPLMVPLRRRDGRAAPAATAVLGAGGLPLLLQCLKITQYLV